MTNSSIGRPISSLLPQARLALVLALGALVLHPHAHAQADTAGRPAGAAVLARPNTAQLPALGDGSELALSAERRLGDRIAREIYHDPDFIDDPVVAEYVDGIWQPLLAATTFPPRSTDATIRRRSHTHNRSEGGGGLQG